MKKLFALIAFIAIVGMITLLSFTPKNHKQTPFSYTSYYYTTSYQRIAPGYNIECTYESSLYEWYWKDISNWTTTRNAYCYGGDYICSISFYSETTADGGSDGELTLQEALNALWAYYIAQSPHNLDGNEGTITVGNCVITIHTKATTVPC
jgi:hypothetical protein